MINSSVAQIELGVTLRNTLRAIDRLVEAGVLREVSGHRRNKLWEAPEVLAASIPLLNARLGADNSTDRTPVTPATYRHRP